MSCRAGSHTRRSRAPDAGSQRHSSTLRGKKTEPGTIPSRSRWSSERTSTSTAAAAIAAAASWGTSRSRSRRASASRSSAVTGPTMWLTLVRIGNCENPFVRTTPGTREVDPTEGLTMFDKLNNQRELFGHKLGSALTMEQDVLDMLGNLEQEAQRSELK